MCLNYQCTVRCPWSKPPLFWSLSLPPFWGVPPLWWVLCKYSITFVIVWAPPLL